MGHGGRRRGAGRKKGAVSARSRAVADDIVASGRTPLAYMLAIMEDTSADPQRRDEMARAAAVYCHPRLSAITASNTNYKGGDDVGIINIFAVPRGARIEKDGTAITIDGAAVELKSLEPFTGTPPLLADQHDYSDQREQPEPERERFEVHELEPPANVSRLDTFRNRRDSEDEGGPGAA